MNNLNLASRKFILTILYAVIFVANYAVDLNIPWEALASLGVMFGIYNIANAVEGGAYAKSDAAIAEAALLADNSDLFVTYDDLSELLAMAGVQTEEPCE